MLHKLLFAVLFTLTIHTAQADHVSGNVRGYCSLAAADGVWMVWFGNTIAQSCAVAESNLRASTWSPIVARRVGYYRVFGYNHAWVRCLNYSNTFWGYGLEPLNRAINTTRWAGGQRCLFNVN